MPQRVQSPILPLPHIVPKFLEGLLDGWTYCILYNHFQLTAAKACLDNDTLFSRELMAMARELSSALLMASLLAMSSIHNAVANSNPPWSFDVLESFAVRELRAALYIPRTTCSDIALASALTLSACGAITGSSKEQRMHLSGAEMIINMRGQHPDAFQPTQNTLLLLKYYKAKAVLLGSV